MKRILIIVIFLIVNQSYAQDFLGVWSFESVDREAIDEDGMSEDEFEANIKRVTNMFSSMYLDFKEDGVYFMNFMGRNKEHSYTFKDNIIKTDDGHIELLPNDKARYTSYDMIIFLRKGKTNIEKSYSYLTEPSYENNNINQELLLGKWKVVEVRAPKDAENSEMIELAGLMLSFKFITLTDMSLGAMGMETTIKYTIDTQTNELIESYDNGTIKKNYTIHELASDYMIVSSKTHMTLLYLEKESDN